MTPLGSNSAANMIAESAIFEKTAAVPTSLARWRDQPSQINRLLGLAEQI